MPVRVVGVFSSDHGYYQSRVFWISANAPQRSWCCEMLLPKAGIFEPVAYHPPNMSPVQQLDPWRSSSMHQYLTTLLSSYHQFFVSFLNEHNYHNGIFKRPIEYFANYNENNTDLQFFSFIKRLNMKE